jgi:uncharacterized membrane protein
MFSYIKRSDQNLLVLNTLLMLNIAFLPFPAALLGEYITSPDERRTALLVYSGTLVWGGVIYNLLWRYAAHGYRLIDREFEPQFVRRLTRRYLLGPTLYAIAFGLAFFGYGEASLLMCSFLALLYVLPGFTHRAS